MDLDLDIRTRGRAPINLTASVVRELGEADILMLGAEKGSKPSAIKRLSDRHHALARALCSGMGPGEAALICGYDISRVSILQADPAFQELLSFYREEKDRAFRSVQDKLAGMAGDALDELQTRIEDEPEKLSVNQLLQIVTMAADRTGNGPSSSLVHKDGDGLADRLEAARERVAARRAQVIEGTKA